MMATPAAHSSQNQARAKSQRRRRWNRDSDSPVSVTSAVLVFALSGLTTLALVSAGVVYFARRTATDEAIRDSRRLTEVVGRGLIEPALDDAILSGDASAVARLDEVVRARVVGESIVRVKLWTRDGVVVYSDESRIVGQQYELATDEIEAFADNAAAAGLSDLGRPENVYERTYHKLLEVYLPVHTPGGATLLFEAYLPYASVTGSGDQIWRNFMPTLVAGLVVLELVQLPLAWSLARRLRRRQDERELLLRRTVEASERERRVIAGELHDGAVQNLVGQSYRLVAAADRLTGVAPDEDVRLIRDAAAHTRSTVQELRSLLVDLYPPNLRTEGIEPALSDLAAQLRGKGIAVTISAPPGLRLPDEAERLLYRAAREAFRNVLQHANASRVEVTLEAGPASARVTVEDDGHGFSASERAKHRSEGHLGLDLIENLVRDSGGHFSIGPGVGGGTCFDVEVPVS